MSEPLTAEQVRDHRTVLNQIGEVATWSREVVESLLDTIDDRDATIERLTRERDARADKLLASLTSRNAEVAELERSVDLQRDEIARIESQLAAANAECERLREAVDVGDTATKAIRNFVATMPRKGGDPLEHCPLDHQNAIDTLELIAQMPLPSAALAQPQPAAQPAEGVLAHWRKPTPGMTFYDGDQFLVAVPVVEPHKGETRWEYSVVLVDCDGEDVSFKTNDSPDWGWEWSDVEWFIPLSEFRVGSPPAALSQPTGQSMEPFIALAKRVVEIFGPMQAKGQNGDTFERLLCRAESAFAALKPEGGE